MRDTNPKLKMWGVDLTEARLMVALLENERLSAGDIVRIMALPQSTISHQVKRLEKLGYVSRTTSEKDSRVVITSLTERGRQVAREANAHSREVTDRLLAAIGEDEIDRVRAAMKRVDAVFANS